MLTFATLVIGTLTLLTSPPPGAHYHGEDCRITLAGDGMRLDRITVDGCEVYSPPDASGLEISNSTFSGVRSSNCYRGGGQALVLTNNPGNRPKIVRDSRFYDYDCIAISTYNRGPVNDIWLLGNEALDPDAEALYGPHQDYSGLRLIGNRFRNVRVGHAGYFPTPSGTLKIARNDFSGSVRLDLPDHAVEPFRSRDEIQPLICGNIGQLHRFRPRYVEVDSMPIEAVYQRTNSRGVTGWLAGAAYVQLGARTWKMAGWTYEIQDYPAYCQDERGRLRKERSTGPSAR